MHLILWNAQGGEKKQVLKNLRENSINNYAQQCINAIAV